MKFDIYNKDTWEDVPVVSKVDNRAVGAIGQKIGELRSLREKLIGSNCDKSNLDYKLATELNDRVHEQMNIKIIYADDAYHTALKDIDYILNAWTNVNERSYSWRNLISYFERLKPFLESKNVKSLLEIIVKGNDAWEVYVDVEKDAIRLRESNAKLREENSKLRGMFSSHEDTTDEWDLRADYLGSD
jgi:hypothetical protein